MAGRTAKILVALLGVLVPATALAEGERVGVAGAVRGEVILSSRRAARMPVSGDAIFLGDAVRTRAASGLQLLLLDQTSFTIGPDCDLVIDRFVYDPQRSSGEIGASVGRGVMRYVSGLVSRDNPGNVQLRTPVAAVGVRGTIFEAVVGEEAVRLAKLQGLDTTGADPARATFFVLVGPGERRSSLDRPGSVTITTTAGSMTMNGNGLASFVGRKGDMPSKPQPIKTKVTARITESLRAGAGTVTKLGGGETNGGKKGEGKKSGQVEDAQAFTGQSAVTGRPMVQLSRLVEQTTSPNRLSDAAIDPNRNAVTPPVAGSGLTNNVGLEIATYQMANILQGMQTFTQMDVPLYDQGSRDRFDANGVIKVYGAEGRGQLGVYDFILQVTPTSEGPNVSAGFANIMLNGRPGFEYVIFNNMQLGTGASPALIGPSAQATSSFCASANCTGAVNLIGNPQDLITGAAHSLQFDDGGTTYLGTGLAVK